MSSNIILPRSFYERDTLCVAKDLLGNVLKFADYHGVINEVEAYVGQDDPACHAVRGCTPRTAVMFGAAGFSYVYLIYGMYHCLNIVTEREGFPTAVLIRGIDLYKPTVLSLNGPGKLCKKLNITKNNNQIDLTQCHNFCVYDSTIQPEYIATPRIGIKVGTDKLWRFKSK
ncbi:3-methyladenine DNA glycosylase [Arsenophonus sp. ENCA]|uniref:DNA-3-methyladenine glycosylase n=1 Tax=Arsenophonus sp. ENCA TaxID=1987579 RepID=UPI000BC4287A|nr:DNA-3-methyladenine glycosylase [Arsenophonus sp. ENCA]PAV11385.1 3-methyladenine DNA glycosylase [Arsenophonus sp. ENCA]